MSKYQHKKRFGQHFLHDGYVIDLIVKAINPQAEDPVLEIGPGLGALSFPLLRHLDHLTVIEIDRDVISTLQRKGGDNITIHNVDALRTDISKLQTADNRPLRIVGNLPYNISSPLIFHLLENAGIIADMHFMLQKEVVDRIVATPGGKQYGRLSVMVQYFCQCESLLEVPPASFDPPPAVDSAVVRLIPQQRQQPAQDVSLLSKVVAQAFSQRRKTLRNTLKKLLSSDELIALNIDPGLRAENLAVDDFIAISNRLFADA